MIQAKVRCPKCDHPFTVRHAGEMTLAQKQAFDRVTKEAEAIVDRAGRLGDRVKSAFDAFLGRK